MNSAAANNKRRSWSPTVWRLSRKTTIYYQSDISHRSNHDKSIILWNDCCCYVVWTFDGLFFSVNEFDWISFLILMKSVTLALIMGGQTATGNEKNNSKGNFEGLRSRSRFLMLKLVAIIVHNLYVSIEHTHLWIVYIFILVNEQTEKETKCVCFLHSSFCDFFFCYTEKLHTTTVNRQRLHITPAYGIYSAAQFFLLIFPSPLSVNLAQSNEFTERLKGSSIKWKRELQIINASRTKI